MAKRSKKAKSVGWTRVLSEMEVREAMDEATPKPRRSLREIEEISVDCLRNIHILFPGDVFDLAVWIARRDLAVSSPTLRVGTTLHGLANDFARLANCAERPLDAEMVMTG